MIVLDTHVLVWWLSDPGRLSARARRHIKDHANKASIVVSSISAWEIGMLVQKSRLRFSVDVADWIRYAEQIDYIRFLPVDNQIALRSTTLPEPFHKDPADRIIAATAHQVSSAVVTSDQKLRDYPHIETIW